MEEYQGKKYIRMTTEPVGRLICELAAPCIISMLVTSIYNMADTYFVGKLNSNSATGAVGVVFSLMAVIQAIGFFFGHGSGNYISRKMGAQDMGEARRMSSTGFTLALLAGGVLCVLGEIFLTPLANLLGATPTILPYARDYMRIILAGAPWMTASLVLNNQLRFQGSAAYGMVGISAGAVMNIALDPVFIFVLDMGVSGAALATILSQFASFCLLLWQCGRGGNLRPHLREAHVKLFYLKEIVRGGLPSLARQGLASLATVCLNRSARGYGDTVIAAMAVVTRVMMFGGSALIGFGQGFQPVCGFNYGAKLYHRVRQGFWFCVKWGTAFLAVVCALGVAFAPEVVALFRNDPEVVRVGALAMRCQCVGFLLSGWVVFSNMTLQTIGDTGPATFLAAARQGVFFIPAVLLLPRLFDLWGILLAQPMADILSFTTAVPLMLRAFGRMKKAAAADAGCEPVDNFPQTGYNKNPVKPQNNVDTINIKE
ncbi:MatE efflux family protein [Oscillibacter valericigenes Sjm18-20]|nr:MatE efflux family protein [Oscillibacter valericigenes Sjm18-20]